jgi:gas vesicle protein
MTTNQSKSFLIGFLVGASAGAVAALMWAPQSGEKTRTQIREKGIELKGQAEGTYADLKEMLETTTAELQAEIQGLPAKVDEAMARSRDTVSRQVTTLRGEPSPVEEPIEIEEEAVGA